MAVGARLFERDGEIGEVDRRLRAAAQGRGGLLVVTGPAGIGRTRLAQVVAASAREHGFLVREAQGHRFEEDVPYGVLRQLLDAPAVELDGVAMDEVSVGGAPVAVSGFTGDEACSGWTGEGAAFHDLYRSAVALAGLRPLVLIVDDAHWADTQSLRWLHYLARRSARLRVLTVVFGRCDEETRATPMMAALRAIDPAGVIGLKPLSGASMSLLLDEALDGIVVDGDERARLAAACMHSTGGNPFLLCELIGEIRSASAASTGARRPIGSLVSPAVSDAVLARLRALGPAAIEVARAAVVLGESGRIDQVAELAGVDRATAAIQCDLLRRCGVLEAAGHLRFVYPLVAAAIRREIPAACRSLLHTRAARLLAKAGAPAPSIAGQLLETAPAGDRWVVRSLRHAARRALDAGAPEIAVHYLARAVNEPPAAHLQGRVRLEWGNAAAMIDPRSAIPQFELALQLGATDRTRCAAALGLARALARCDRLVEADHVLAKAAAANRNSSARARLQAERLLWNRWWRALPDLDAQAARPAESDDPRVKPLAQALGMWELALAGEPLGDTIPSGGPSWVDEESGIEYGLLLAQTLVCGGRLQAARAMLDDGLAELDKHGRRGEDRRLVLSLRAVAALRLGELAQAEQDAREAWLEVSDLGESASELASWWWSAGALASVQIARGDLVGAQDLVTRAGLGGRARAGLVLPDPLAVRGRLRLAQGRFAEAVADLRAAGRGLEARGCTNPSSEPWQIDLALALRAQAPDEAMAVAQEALQRTRAATSAGSAWALGRALRTVGQLVPGSEGLAAFEESVNVLSDSSAGLEYAASLIDWGAALRRANRREAAREPLLGGLQLADCYGAAGLVERARRELAAAGARPRRIRLTGPAALTPSEARVAALAVDGLGNVQIARTLQVTRKTVEKHLANVYLKLDISSRRDLAGVLGGVPGSGRGGPKQ
jgi:DNA-binding CsgD family transcriptional regulator